MELRIDHLGMSGLRLLLDGEPLRVDPPAPSLEPALLTWTEAERVAGAGPGSGRVLAPPAVLSWLGRPGIALRPGVPLELGALTLTVRPYQPIPYATPAEAWRKTCIALRHPHRAARRLSFTLRRPRVDPVCVRLDWKGVRIALCQQALHRFVQDDDLEDILGFFQGADVALASPDFEDEHACGELLGRLGAPQLVLVDSIGPVRRMLGLPTRPLDRSQVAGAAGAALLEDGGTVVLQVGS